MYIQMGKGTTPMKKSAIANPMIKVCLIVLCSHLSETYAPMTRPFPITFAIARKAYDDKDRYSSAGERIGCTRPGAVWLKEYDMAPLF